MQQLSAGIFRFFVAPKGRAARIRTASIAALAVGVATLSATEAGPDTRSLKLYHLHTGQHITITFKQNGRYIPDALNKLDQFVGDWRQQKSIKMDPVLYDLLWTVYQDSGSTGEIHIVCGYRAPETNSMLRRRSKGVAKNSQHMKGKAMDFFIPGAPLEKVRNIGLRLEVGGVGYYPASGSPFVHMDTGSVRHWPSMTREQLVRVFPRGHTLHLPSDGQPLPGYEQALAEYRARGAAASVTTMVASASTSGSATGTLGDSTAIAALSGNLAMPPPRGRESALPAIVKAQPAARVALALADESEADDADAIVTPAVADAIVKPAASEHVALASYAPAPRPAVRSLEPPVPLLGAEKPFVASIGASSRRYMLVGKASPGKSITQRLAVAFGTFGFGGSAEPAQAPAREIEPLRSSEPPVQEPQRVMAFAASTETTDRDPLHIMQQQAKEQIVRKAREAASKPGIAPEITASIAPVEPTRPSESTAEPAAKLVFAAANADWGRTLWTVNTSTRQLDFAEMMMPDPEGDPSILQTPTRVVAGGFSGKPYEGLRTDHFAGLTNRPVGVIDLTEPRRFAWLLP